MFMHEDAIYFMLVIYRFVHSFSNYFGKAQLKCFKRMYKQRLNKEMQRSLWVLLP